MNKEEAIDKAVRLLRLAKSDNPHEAASAAAKAQEIMDRYKLGALSAEEEPGAVQQPDEPIRDFDRGDKALDVHGSQIVRWKVTLAARIARANQCRIYTTSWDQVIRLPDGYPTVSTKRGIAIVGRPSDVESVRYLYQWLVKEVERLAARDGAGMGKTWRNNFRLGVVDTIANRLAEERRTVVAAMKQEAGNPMAIVRVDTALARMEKQGADVDDWMKVNLKLRMTYDRSNYDPNAREQGRAAGKEIDMGRAKGALGPGHKMIGSGG